MSTFNKTNSFRKQKLQFTFLAITLFLSSFIVSTFAQTFPPASSCTSKDLELVSATLPPTGNDPCACGGTRTLMLGIANKTGSTRTSFALWGILKRYSASGVLTSSTPIFACAGPIPKNSTTILPSNRQITVSCGESLEIVDLYLAWTSASPGETCAVLEASPSTINPKCGTLPRIQVDLGVNGNLAVTNGSCTSTGQVVVSPYGGVAPYTVALGSDSRQVPAGGSTTFTGLSPDTYSFTVTDHNGCSIQKTSNVTQPDQVSTPAATVNQPTCSVANGTVNVTSPNNAVTYTLEQNGNTMYTAVSGVFSSVVPGTYQFRATRGNCSTLGSNVEVNNPPAIPDAPLFTVTQPTLCGSSTGSITICNPVVGSTYSIIGGASITAQTGQPVVFTGLAAGSNPSLRVTNAAGCVSLATSCANAQTSCSSGSVTNNDLSSVTEVNVAVGSKKIGIKTFPNPYSHVIRFVINSEESGQGKLELVNMLGQKVKTVYQGQIREGAQNFEITVPPQHRSALIYVMTLNGKRYTGKLLNSNR